MTINGSCLCGTVTFSVIDAFEHFFICHCKHCQKDSGSAFAANLFIRKDAITWLSGQHNVTHFRLAGTRHVRSFCATCGAAVPDTKGEGDMAVVPAGALDKSPSKAPDAHIMTLSAPCWEASLETLKRCKSYPE